MNKNYIGNFVDDLEITYYINNDIVGSLTIYHYDFVDSQKRYSDKWKDKLDTFIESSLYNYKNFIF